MNTTVKTTKRGLYVETHTEGVSSVILREHQGLWDLAVPDHRMTGAYWKRLKGMTTADLRAVEQTIQRALEG